MNKFLATLIAGLFATSVFAQAPSAPAAAPAATTTKAVKADVKETKAVAKADAKETKTDAKADEKAAGAKQVATVSKVKAHHEAPKAKAHAVEANADLKVVTPK